LGSLEIIIVGRIPPPYGGATVSVLNLIKALNAKNIINSRLSIKSITRRYTISHVHYFKPINRFLGVIISLLLAKKVIFTVHWYDFNTTNILNKLSLYLSDGVILLNRQIQNECNIVFKKSKIFSTVLSPLFIEGYDKIESIRKYFDRQDGKKYLLLYANKKVIHKGKDLYGVNFIIDNIERLSEKFIIVFVDLNSNYLGEVDNINMRERIIYINHFVDFRSILKQVDVYIRPSSGDGCSVAIIEALSNGVPVLASDSVPRDKNVLTYKYGDFGDFSEKLNCIQYNPDPKEPPSVNQYLQYINTIIHSSHP